jgi:hypothetical protein
MRQAQDAPGTFAVVQTDYLRGVAMGKAVARILPLQRTAPDGAVLAQGMRYTASKPIVKGAYDEVIQCACRGHTRPHRPARLSGDRGTAVSRGQRAGHTCIAPALD